MDALALKPGDAHVLLDERVEDGCNLRLWMELGHDGVLELHVDPACGECLAKVEHIVRERWPGVKIVRL